jgi:ribosomal protein L14E/L6E/L27E
MLEGTVVFSKAGRDKSKALVVLFSEEAYVFLADGKERPIARPKKKKMKHVQPTNFQINLQPECGRMLQDADVRKMLKEYCEGGKNNGKR